MKYLQYLIFISGLVFTFSQGNIFDGFGQTGGIEVFQISIIPSIHVLNPISFTQDLSYIILRTEYDDSVPTDNVSSVENKKGKSKLMKCFSSSSFEKIEQEEREMNFRYTIYYIIRLAVNSSNYLEGLNVTMNYVGQLFECVGKRTNRPITIIKEQHKIESNELRSLLFPGNTDQTSEVISDQWRRSEKIKFNYNLLSKLYKLSLFRNIEELRASAGHINLLDAFVAYYDTKLIAFTTSNKKLQEYTNNFVEFIQRCSSEELEVYKVENFNSIFRNNFNIQNRGQKDANEEYTLYEYNNACVRVSSIFARTGLRNLHSQFIKPDRHYILQNEILKEVYIFIKPSIDTDTLKCLLKEEKRWAIFNNYYKIRIFQTHKLNVSVLIAFKDLIRDLLNNDVTDNVRKFITVCKDKHWYNPSTELAGSTSSAP